ncbi:MAG: iron-sulfur cluster assembly protein [Proteobacteria bacterium]|nr:iron-sulfur cluster assembly protein [Pseudomonadota bacterium]
MSFTKDDIIAALKMVFDPEIPVNVWDLGLIYDIDIVTRDAKRVTRKTKDTNAAHHASRVTRHANIKMTLTSPTCPIAEDIVMMVRTAAESVAGVGNVNVELVWDPPWSLDKMTPAARLELDLTEEGW